MSRIIKAALCCMIMVGVSLHSICQTIIKMKKQGNVYILPCRVNGYLMNMFFDTGADDVSISLSEALYMVKNGYLSENDITGKESYKTANGDITEGTKIIIRKITFAGLEINDVAASVMPDSDAPLLFGQSAIGKLGKIQIDPADNTLTVFKGKGTYDYSKNGDGSKEEIAADVNTRKEMEPYTPSNKISSAATLTKVMRLKIDRQGGANGANIAWHPVQKKYYAAMAGNVSFPMEVFDANGQIVSPDNLETMFDVRGLWYNTSAKTLQANGYNDFGWLEYVLDAKGIPVATRKINVPSGQPDIQSVGAYDANNQLIYFYDMQSTGIEPHRIKDGIVYKTIHLYLGIKSMADRRPADEDEAKYNYNGNAIIFTGIPQAEIGLLNVRDRQIELYNISTGLMSKTFKLPEDAPVQPSLNFSYSNGIFWLFDKAERIWQGYK